MEEVKVEIGNGKGYELRKKIGVEVVGGMILRKEMKMFIKNVILVEIERMENNRWF